MGLCYIHHGDESGYRSLLPSNRSRYETYADNLDDYDCQCPVRIQLLHVRCITMVIALDPRLFNT